MVFRSMAGTATLLGIGMGAMTPQAYADNPNSGRSFANPTPISSPLTDSYTTRAATFSNPLQTAAHTFLYNPTHAPTNPLSLTGNGSFWSAGPVMAAIPPAASLPPNLSVGSAMHFGSTSFTGLAFGAEATRQTLYPINPSRVILKDMPAMGSHPYSAREPFFPRGSIELKNTTQNMGIAAGLITAGDASYRLVSGMSEAEGTEAHDALRVTSGSMLATQAGLYGKPFSRRARPLMAAASLGVGGAQVNEVLKSSTSEEITNPNPTSELFRLLETLGFIGLMFLYGFKNSSKGFWRQLKSALSNPAKFWRDAGFTVYNGKPFDVVIKDAGIEPQSYAAWGFISPITHWRGHISRWNYWFRQEADAQTLADFESEFSRMEDEFNSSKKIEGTITSMSVDNETFPHYVAHETDKLKSKKIDVPKTTKTVSIEYPDGERATHKVQTYERQLADGSVTTVTETSISFSAKGEDGSVSQREIKKTTYEHVITLPGNESKKVKITSITLPGEKDSHDFLEEPVVGPDGEATIKLHEIMGMATLLDHEKFDLPFFGVEINEHIQGSGFLRQARRVLLAFTEDKDNPGPSVANYITEVKSKVLMLRSIYESTLHGTGYTITTWHNFHRPTMHDLGYHDVNRVMAIVRQQDPGFLGWLRMQRQKVSDYLLALSENRRSAGVRRGFVSRTEMRSETVGAYLRPKETHGPYNDRSDKMSADYHGVPFERWPDSVG